MSRYFAPKMIAKRDHLTYLEFNDTHALAEAHYKDGTAEATGAYALKWVEDRVKTGSWVEMPMPPLHISESEFDALCAREMHGNVPSVLLPRLCRFLRAEQFHKIAERLEDLTATNRSIVEQYIKTG